MEPKKTLRKKKRKLSDLNLLDDFLFGSMMTYPEIGEAFSRELLGIIFQKKFGNLTVVPQKFYYGRDGQERQGGVTGIYGDIRTGRNAD